MNIIALQIFYFTLLLNKSAESIFAAVFGYLRDWLCIAFFVVVITGYYIILMCLL